MVKFIPTIGLIMEPGDATRYYFTVTKCLGAYQVNVMNPGFEDKITFIDGQEEPYETSRGEKTNPWTIKAARQAVNLYKLAVQGDLEKYTHGLNAVFGYG
jgi:hypothetical protein